MSVEPSRGTGYVKTYTYDNAAAGERDRLRLLETTWDPGSTSLFTRLGVGAGWRILMVAGGGGSLVEWVAQRVGTAGRVLTTDLDPRFLRPLIERYRTVEVRQHNVVTEELPTAAFDLVHTRLLVAHLPEREQVLRKMAAALKPGGWLVVEDFDAASFGPVEMTPAAEKIRAASGMYLISRGYEHFTGRRLPGTLRAMGLEDVDAFGTVYTLRGKTSSLAQWYVSTFLLQKAGMIVQGLITEEEAQGLVDRYSDPDYDGLSHTLMTVWGRRPRL